MTTASVTDGRSARSQRTRTAVVDALLALLRDGNLRPTAREIAERARVSLRSVYVHFDDLEDLFFAVAHRQFELVTPMLTQVPSTGALGERADTLVRARARLHEDLGPVRRAAELQEPFSPTLSRMLGTARAAGRDQLARVFARELKEMRADRRARVLAALDAMTGAATWETLRSRHHLSRDEAVRCVVETVVVVLGTSP